MKAALSAARRTPRRYATVVAVIVASMAMAVAPQAASAYIWNQAKLSGGSWNLVFETNSHAEEVAKGETTSTLCDGPMVKSGGGFVTVYGWHCEAKGKTEFNFTRVTAFPAIYNPNAGTIFNLGGYGS